MPDLGIKHLSPPVAVVCHDAGAANLILSWLDESDLCRIFPVMMGPARQSWHERFGSPAPVSGLYEAMAKASSLLSGTGWSSDLEHRARKLAHAREIPSVAVIDHWVNYCPRFERDGEIVLPDRIWVADNFALALARDAFNLPVDVRPNTYLEGQAAMIGAPTTKGDVLFVAEPARSNWGREVPGEFQSLDYFLKNRAEVGIDPHLPIRLRPHPSDPLGKYDEWLQQKSGHVPIRIDHYSSLTEAMRPAYWVAGGQSFALVVALSTGRKALSVLPPWAPDCAIPVSGLIRLCEIYNLGNVPR